MSNRQLAPKGSSTRAQSLLAKTVKVKKIKDKKSRSTHEATLTRRKFEQMQNRDLSKWPVELFEEYSIDSTSLIKRKEH